jgi:hypothetical protein
VRIVCRCGARAWPELAGVAGVARAILTMRIQSHGGVLRSKETVGGGIYRGEGVGAGLGFSRGDRAKVSDLSMRS